MESHLYSVSVSRFFSILLTMNENVKVCVKSWVLGLDLHLHSREKTENTKNMCIKKVLPSYHPCSLQVRGVKPFLGFDSLGHTQNCWLDHLINVTPIPLLFLLWNSITRSIISYTLECVVCSVCGYCIVCVSVFLYAYLHTCIHSRWIPQFFLYSNTFK